MEPTDQRSFPPDLVHVAALVGLGGIAAGSLILAGTDLGFDPARALPALLSWIPVTLGPVLLVLVTSILALAAGISMGAAIRGRPFMAIGDALLEGAVWTVVLEAGLLGVLAGVGLFSQPLLLVGHVVVVIAGRLRGPVIDAKAHLVRPTLTPLGVLIVVAWAAPILLMLASPVVPFIDVLPNHVAPAEHLRTFGSLAHLTDTQSPIYGPSRIFIGYTALLGAITTMSGLPAGAALAAFILPSTIAVAAGVARLARSLGGASTVRWALLLFAMTTTVARLGDARATVVVVPLVAWTLATLADRIAGGPATRAAPGDAAARGTASDPSPPARHRAFMRDGVVLGIGLGTAVLLHPVIGFLLALTILTTVLARPDAVAAVGIPALVTGAVIAVPQAATMAGVALPPVALVVALVLGIGAGTLVAAARAAPVRLALVIAGRLAFAGIGIVGLLIAGPLVRAAVAGAAPLLAVMELGLTASVVAVLLRAQAARTVVLWAALAAGFGVAALTQLVPEKGSGLLGDALRFELPKTLQYWVPVFVAPLAAAGIEAGLRWERLAIAARGTLLIAFVGTAALPIRFEPIDAFHLGEHRLSETFSIAMRWVQSGFWSGYPDSRYIVDGPRQEILAAVRREIVAGRIGPQTPILHVAGSFQQWVATPLGVFTGVTETDVTPDAVVSIHTIGGRLRPLTDLPGLLALGPPGGRAYGYVLFEPDPDHLPPGIRDLIIAAGYEPVFANAQGELFRLLASLK